MPFVRGTRATLRSAEFGFLGVCVYTRVQTPRFWGAPRSAGVFVRDLGATRPFLTSWFTVGMKLLYDTQERLARREPANRTPNGSEREPGSASGKIRAIRAGAALAAGRAAARRRHRRRDHGPLHRGDAPPAASHRAAARAVQALAEGGAVATRLRVHRHHDDLLDAGGVRGVRGPAGSRAVQAAAPSGSLLHRRLLGPARGPHPRRDGVRHGGGDAGARRS